MMVERMKHYFVTSAKSEHLLAQWVTNIMIAVHVGLGISIIVGGSSRFALPTYQPLIALTNGNIWIWGVTIVISAIMMSSPLRVPNIAGLFTGMVWMNIWTVLFAVAVIRYPTAAATPMIAYGGFALIDTALLTARVLEHGKR